MGRTLSRSKRQLGIVRHEGVLAVERVAGLIDLEQDIFEIEMIALRRQAAVDGAGADGDERLAAFAKLAQHMHVLGVADAALDEADIAGTDILDVGQRRAVELDKLHEIEKALVDVEKGGVTAKAAGERDCRNAQFGLGAHECSSPAAAARSTALIGSLS